MKTVPVILSLCVAFAALALLAPPVLGYPTYSEKQIPTYRSSPEVESIGNCVTCHGNFRATNEEDEDPWLRDEYFSPVDGLPWSEVYQEVEATEPEVEVGLHDVHRHIMLDKIGRSRCDVCHQDRDTVGRYPVKLNSSATDDLDPIACVGCHGRYEDSGHDSVSDGLGAGLRQHHTNSGVTVCKTCHEDADPDNYTPVGEDVLPPFYSEPNDVFVNKPTDPCNVHRDEDYAGGRSGLDNDGDGRYDKRDPDCRPIGRGRNHGRGWMWKKWFWKKVSRHF